MNPSDAAKPNGDSRWGWTWREKTEVYFSLYFAMTGMHALHMIIGIALLCGMLFKARRGGFMDGHIASWRTLGCTGTLSILCGFSCFRCCI